MTACERFILHPFRKFCNTCKKPREMHPFDPEDFAVVRGLLGISLQSDIKDKTFAWIPKLCPEEFAEDFFSVLLPAKVPKWGSEGEKFRQRQWIFQLPKCDLKVEQNRFVEEDNREKMLEFVRRRNVASLDEATVKMWTYEIPVECQRCQKVIPRGDMVVIAPKRDDDVAWHPACFRCSDCGELPVDLIHCTGRAGRIYCLRHYDQMSKPRCEACDELIFSANHSKAISKDWHTAHFCCLGCDTNLSGERFVQKNENPYCKPCYEKTFCNTCEECKQRIGVDVTELTFQGKHWHEDCMVCEKCKQKLAHHPFAKHADHIYCVPCYEEHHSARCSSCGKPFKADATRLEYKGKAWHRECFLCSSCLKPIGEKSFVPKKDDIYCTTCFEEKFAKRCAACNQAILKGGLNFKGNSYHRACFKCTTCGTQLKKSKVFAYEDKPYCKDCYDSAFAKRCAKCQEPITSASGSRFVVFEDKSWHYECFTCTKCGTSLVGGSFVENPEGILCPDCAYIVMQNPDTLV